MTPLRPPLKLFAKEDSPELQTPIPSGKTKHKSSFGVSSAGEALRGEVSNTPHRLRHNLQDIKTPKFKPTDDSEFSKVGVNSGRYSARACEDADGADFEGPMKNRLSLFETILEERGTVESPRSGRSSLQESQGPVVSPGNEMRGEEVRPALGEGGEVDFEEWIRTQAKEQGISYDDMFREAQEEAEAFVKQVQTYQRMSKEAAEKEKENWLNDFEICIPCEREPSPVPSFRELFQSELSDWAPSSPVSISSLGSMPPFGCPPEVDFFGVEDQNIEPTSMDC